MKTFLFALLSMLAFSRAGAQTHPLDSLYSQCIEKDPSTAGMIGCATQLAAAWDAELNKQYQRLIKALPPAQQEQLRASQRAWIAFRDKELAFTNPFYSAFDGTMWRPIAANIRMERTRERALQLQTFYEDWTMK